MELGVVLPDESPSMPVEALVVLARQAEELGYAHAWLPDHVLPPGPFGAEFGGVHEPLVTMAHLGALTRTIRFGTSVMVLPLRNPFLLAKQVATLQELSGGRVVLGVGIGWNEEEYAAVGGEFRSRGAVADDSLAVIRHLLGGGSAPYDGRRFSYESGVFAPVPQTPVPVLVGGNSDAALRRAARYADLWQSLPTPPQTFTERATVLAELAPERTVSPGVRVQWDDDRPVGRVAEEVAAYRAAGAEHLAVHFGHYEEYGERMAALVRAL